MRTATGRSHAALAAAIVAVVLGASGGARAGNSELPNLAPLPPFDVQLGVPDGGHWTDPKTVIRFSIGVANRGAGRLELVGVPRDAVSSTAMQCVAFVADAPCREYREVGSFVFHPLHGHWHLQDFALYELRPLTPSGEPDMASPPIATSGKVSFCLTDIAQEDPQPWPQVHWFWTCTGVLQGITPGWMDVYDWLLAGQQLSIAGVPDGRYAVMVSVDPDRILLETTRDDDVAFARIELAEGGTTVRVLP